MVVRVAVFGVGGVGGYAVEVLARSGVGAIDVIDDDRVCLTNVNRQLLATTRTVGKHKVDVAEERIHSINPRVSCGNIRHSICLITRISSISLIMIMSLIVLIL